MNRRFHKRAITAAAAVMTLTTVVTSVDATGKNNITIEADRASVSAGESFGLLVGLDTDNVGVSGFTIDFHYDSDAVSLNIPDESEYAPDSKFALVTNFEYADGIVRIVGANMTGSNVKGQTVIADLGFTVKDGYDGDIGFWTQVQDLVYTDGDEFVNAEFTAYGEYDRYTVKNDTPVVTAAPETEPIVTEPETQPETETETVSSETETEPQLPETFIPPETVLIPETTLPETEPATDTETETETEPVSEPPEESLPDEDGETDTQPEEEEPQSGDVLFEHRQGSEDFVGETDLQYIFDPSVYTDAEGTVDISVTVESDGTASGGIGMQTDDGWKIYSANADGSGETVWSAEDVDLSEVSGSIAVQLYYLEHDSDFKITSISITSDGAEAPAPEETPADDGEQSDDGSEIPLPAVPEPAEVPDEDEQVTSAPDAVPETETESETIAPDETELPETDAPAAEPAITEAPRQEAPETDTTTTTTAAPAASPSGSSTSAVSAASTPVRDGNPQTGSKVLGRHALPFGIIALCLGQIAYSTFRLTRKEN